MALVERPRTPSDGVRGQSSRLRRSRFIFWAASSILLFDLTCFAEIRVVAGGLTETRAKVWKKMVRGPIKVTSSDFHSHTLWRGYEALKRQLKDIFMRIEHRKTLALAEAWFEGVLRQLSTRSGVGYPVLTGDGFPKEDDFTFGEDRANVNKLAERAMRKIFKAAVLEAATQGLPRDLEHVLRHLNEESYGRLRPAIERIFYAGLSALYEVQLAQSASENVTKNLRHVIESDPCPFSMYTSFGFVADILQGATPREAAEAYGREAGSMPHEYVSPECEQFKKSMEERLDKDATSFAEAVAQLSSAVRGRSFYEMSSLVEAAEKNSPGMGEAGSREERSRLSRVVSKEDRKRSRSPPHQKNEVIPAAVVEKVRVKAASSKGPDLESMVQKTRAEVSGQTAFSLADLVRQSGSRPEKT